jgi:hypothetical protein
VTATGEGAGFLRGWVQPVYTSILYALAIVGIVLVPRVFAALVLALLAYETFAALVFVGATRYRIPWDFLLAILAGAAVTRIVSPRLAGRTRSPDPRDRRLGETPADAAAGAGGTRARAGDAGAGRPGG